MIKSKFDILLILFMINVLLIIARKDNQNINTLHFIFYFLLKNLLFVNRFDYVLLNTLLFVNRFDYVLLKKIVSEAKPVYICVLFIANFFYNYN